MGIFWEGAKSAATQWASATRKMNRSDVVIKNMTGFNPKHLHRSLYKAIGEDINTELQNYYFFGNPLSDEEVTLIKLMYLCDIANSAEDYGNAENFGSAISRLRRISRDQIRAEISLKAISYSR